MQYHWTMIELFIYMLTMSITPGPNTILSMVNAASVGLRKGIGLNIGMLCGISAVTLIAWLATSLLYSAIPQAESVMKGVAVIYLAYLAIRMLRAGTASSSASSATFIEGMLLQLVNVKVYLLALTAIAAYIMPMDLPRLQTALLVAAIPAICFISGLVWAVGGSLLRSVYERRKRLFSIIFALLLIWCAISLII